MLRKLLVGSSVLALTVSAIAAPTTTTTFGQLPAGGTPAGTDLVAAWQSGHAVTLTIDQIIALAGGSVPSVFGRTGAVTAQSGDYTFAQIGSTPTTISGYGITDAVSLTGAQTLSGKSLDFSLNTATKIPLSAFTNLGTATTVLHGNASGSPTFGAINLGTDITGTLGVANGGTGITSLGSGIATFLGTPSGANLASALTSALPITKGGTGGTAAGVALLTSLGGLTGTASSTTVVCGNGTWCTPPGSGTVNSGTTGQLAYYASAGTAVSGVGPGTSTTLLHGNASGAPTFGAVNLGTDVTGSLSTASLSNSQNAQTATSYTFVSGDGGKTVVRSNAGSMTDTLPQATGSFAVGYGMAVGNLGPGSDTIGTTTSLFPNGTTSLVLATGQYAMLEATAAGNWLAGVTLPVMAQATVLGRASGSGSDYPLALSQAQLTALINQATTTLSGAIPATGTPSGKYLKDDLTWAPVSASYTPAAPIYVSGRWYMAAPFGSINNGSALTANTVYWRFWFQSKAVTLQAIGAKITTAAAGGHCQIGVSATSGVGITGAPLATTGDIATDTAGNVSGTLSVSLSANTLYAAGLICDNSTVAFATGGSVDNWNGFWVGASSTGNLTANATNAHNDFNSTGTTYPVWPSSPTLNEGFTGTAPRTPIFFFQAA